MRVVAYERVSAARQGAGGLGIAAQREAIESYAEAKGATILARFTKVEGGRCPDRPELAKALHPAKVTGAALVIAKLDGLSRNAAFLLTPKDSGVRFAAADLPEANDLTVGIMALVAQQEREAVSRRTKEALSVAKSHGVKLDNLPKRRRGAQAGRQGRRAAQGGHRAQRRPARLRPCAGAGGPPGGRRDQPASDRRRAQRARHAYAARRAVARLDGDELAGPAWLAGGGMRQSRLMSLIEALANVAVGYGVAVLTQIVVFPLFGLQASLAQNLKIGLIFTAVSIVRGYALRRAFEGLRQARAGTVNGP